MVLISQLYLFVLAAVLAIAPRYYLLVLLVYFALVFMFSALSARRTVRGARVSREEVEAARRLFVEKDALDIAAADDELLKLYTRQAKATLITFAFFPLYWAIFEAARRLQPSFAELLEAHGVSGRLAGFLLWVMAFEAMFAISFLSRRLILGARASQQPPMVPRAYEVTEKGIVIKGAMGSVIGFPLPDDAEVHLDESKGYVEIVFGKGGRIRLYTKKPRRLYDLIMRFGVQRRQERG
jgi:uncharacterized membrane protein